MWSCPKCKEEIEDQFDTCWRCAGHSQDLVQSDGSHAVRPARFFYGVRLVIAFLLLFATSFGPSYGFDHLGAQSIRSRFWLGICSGLACVVLAPVVLYGRVWQKVVAMILGIICGWAFYIAVSYLHLKATR